MVSAHQMSERHACALVGLSRDAYRHEGQSSAINVKLGQAFALAVMRAAGVSPYVGEFGVAHAKVMRTKQRVGLAIQAARDLAHRMTDQAPEAKQGQPRPQGPSPHR